MAIDVEWQDERGRTLLSFDGPPIDHRLAENARPDSACLRFIDSFGDTVFNCAQVAVLESELRVLSVSAGEVGEQARALLGFINRVEERVHCYLKFIGD